MSKVPAYSIEGDRCVFGDGTEYRITPCAPGQTKATPEEMYRILTGAGLPKASAAELAQASSRRVNLGTVDMRG
jgi:hypothetical protein